MSLMYVCCYVSTVVTNFEGGVALLCFGDLIDENKKSNNLWSAVVSCHLCSFCLVLFGLVWSNKSTISGNRSVCPIPDPYVWSAWLVNNKVNPSVLILYFRYFTVLNYFIEKCQQHNRSFADETKTKIYYCI